MHVIFLRKHIEIGLFANMHAYACRENIAKKVSYEYKLCSTLYKHVSYDNLSEAHWCLCSRDNKISYVNATL